MGKVWLKTKYDSGMNMEIPHSVNIANAMYGFRELGAEIIPYHKIDEIYEMVAEYKQVWMIRNFEKQFDFSAPKFIRIADKLKTL